MKAALAHPSAQVVRFAPGLVNLIHLVNGESALPEEQQHLWQQAA